MKSLYLHRWDAFIRYYPFTGRGTPIVFLPALSFPSIRNFLPVVTHPRIIGSDVTLVDLLGGGLSDRPKGFTYSMEDHADTVAAILDEEGLSGITLVGHSMGGTVAIMLALQRPDLVSNLIVVEGNLTPGGGATTSHIASFSPDEYIDDVYPRQCGEWRNGAIAGDPVSAFHHDVWGTADPYGLHANATSLVNLDRSLLDRYLNMQIRRTFIYGEHTVPKRPDDVTPDAPDPEELRARGVAIHVVPEAGHMVMIDNLDGFVDTLTQAIDSIR